MELNYSVHDLIEAVKNRPAIYNASRKDFKVPEQKEQTWMSIAKDLQASVDDCKRRWRTIRERYTRELKRLKYSSEDEQSNWEYFDEMSFLNEHIKYRRVKSGYNTIIKYEQPTWNEIDPILTNDVDSNQKPEIESRIEYDIEEEEEEETQNYYDSPEKSRTVTKRTFDQSTKSSLSTFDEEGFFGNSVACTLRKLTRLNNIKAKVEIFKVLEKFVELEELEKCTN